MRGSRKNQIVAIIIVVTCIAGFTLFNLSIVANDGVFLPQFGGYFYMSEVQDNHSNSSYSIIFHEVNFTFLYWYWPLSWVENNLTVYIAEQPVSVYVQVTFPDNSSEILTIIVDSPSSCLIGISGTLRGELSTHSSPRIGIATAETEELHCSWVYLVAVL